MNWRNLWAVLSSVLATVAVGSLMGWYAGISAQPIVGAVFALVGVVAAAVISARGFSVPEQWSHSLTLASLLLIVFVLANWLGLHRGIERRIHSQRGATADWFARGEPVLEVDKLPADQRLMVVLIYKRLHTLEYSDEEIALIMGDILPVKETETSDEDALIMAGLSEAVAASELPAEVREKMGGLLTRAQQGLTYGQNMGTFGLMEMLTLLDEEIRLRNGLADARMKRAYATKTVEGHASVVGEALSVGEIFYSHGGQTADSHDQ